MVTSGKDVITHNKTSLTANRKIRHLIGSTTHGVSWILRVPNFTICMCFPKESSPHDSHLLHMDEGVFDVYKLIHLTSHIQPVEIEVAILREKLMRGDCWKDFHSIPFSPHQLLFQVREHGSLDELGLDPSYFSWIDHIWQIRRADYRHPILMYRGEVIDGMHRVVHAIIDSVKSMPVRILPELPKAARVTDSQ